MPLVVAQSPKKKKRMMTGTSERRLDQIHIIPAAEMMEGVLSISEQEEIQKEVSSQESLNLPSPLKYRADSASLPSDQSMIPMNNE